MYMYSYNALTATILFFSRIRIPLRKKGLEPRFLGPPRRSTTHAMSSTRYICLFTSIFKV